MTIALRENIETWALDSPKLYQFRRGIEEMQKISDQSLMDERGYQWCAGVHGGFGGQPYCQHGNLNFVTWHRPYILDFETKLRDQIAKVAGAQAAEDWRLPYWNWASRNVQGMPKAFTEKTYKDGSQTKPNPLYSMAYDLSYWPGPPVANPWPTETYRDAETLSELQALRAPVLKALKKPQFSSFSPALEQPHNGLHVWVNGYMVTFRSSFDPIFWCHHANIDRQWWIWQQEFGNSSIPASVRNFTCTPFSFQDNRAEAFFNTRDLGYEYTGEALNAVHEDIVSKEKPKKKADTINFDIGSLNRDIDRAELQVAGMRHTEETHQVRVFANNKSASIKTSRDDKSGYLGTITVLGHGKCPGASGHCKLRTGPQFSGDVRAAHHLSPFDCYLDITEGLQNLANARKKAGCGKINLSFVVVGADRKAKPSSSIKFDSVRVSAD